MLSPAKRNATEDDVRDAPEGMRAELIDGDLYLQPRPRVSHQHAVAALGGALSDADWHRDGEPSWIILPEVELHIPYTLVPDLAGWHRERFVEPIDAPYITVTPDFVVEVLSPSTHAYDRGLKAQKYLDRNVWYLWLVDPAERTLEVLENQGSAWLLRGVFSGDETVNAPPFEDVALSLSRLWSL